MRRMKALLVALGAVLSLCLFPQIVLTEAEPCSQNDTLRLSRTSTISSPDENVGRLEVCASGTWGTIALMAEDHFWSEKNIQVACRHLGFSGGLNSIPPVEIPDSDKSPSNLSIHMMGVACRGQESALTNCSFMTIRNMQDPDPSAHHSDVFIVCRPKLVDYSDLHVAGQQIGDVRLFGNVESGQGAVEILTSLGWTGICPDSWTSASARVVCQALGYDLGLAEDMEVSNSGVKRLVHDGRCSDDPESDDSARVQAKMCSFQEIRGNECSASSDHFAAIKCESRLSSSTHPVRLFGQGDFAEDRIQGVVEIFQDDRWGVVCAAEDSAVAQVNVRGLCEELFFHEFIMDTKQIVLPQETLHEFESSLKPLWSRGVHCPDTITNTDDCEFLEPLGFADCSSHHILALDCGPTLEVSTTEGQTTAIIVGVLVTVFVFVLVFFIFATVLCKLFRRRPVPSPFTGPYEVSAGDLPRGNAGDLIAETGFHDRSGASNEFELKKDMELEKPDGTCS